MFATETLAFGVNLAADCIILMDIRFPRESQNSDEEQEYQLLTPNQYHNILGRAGRYGKVDKNILSLAEVCIPAYYHKSLVIEMLRDCYSGMSRKKICLSTALLDSDIVKMEEKEISTLDDVSYQSFRSVMDALRHVSENDKHVRANSITSLFKKTVYWKTERKDTLKAAEELIETILQLSAEYKRDLSLVDVDKTKNPPAYRIQAQAEALIDTGTRWQSVSPMQRWLNRITEIKESTLRNPPPELLIPAFVASRDLWPVIKMFCWEGRDDKGPSEWHKDLNEHQTKMDLEAELRRIEGIEKVDVELIAAHISEYVDDLGSERLKIKHPEYCKAAFYKSVTAFLMWLRGADLEDINELSLKPAQNKDQFRPFSQKYYEKASWLAVMCLRFFEGSTVLLHKHLRELPHLSVRLRCGYPFEGLPFIQYKNSKAELQRGQVQELLRCGITASKIIKNKNPPDYISSKSDLAEEIKSNRKFIIDDVFEYYRKQVQVLISEIKINEMDEQWKSFISLMNKFFRLEDARGSRIKGSGLPHVSNNDIEEFTEILRRTFKNRIKTPSEVKIPQQTDGKKIRLIKGERKNLLFHIAKPDEKTSELNERTVVIRLPWRSEGLVGDKHVELTAFGGMVLAVLVGVEMIKFNSLFNRFPNFTIPKTISIKDIVDEFNDEDNHDFQSARQTKEAMLTFNEPGLDSPVQ